MVKTHRKEDVETTEAAVEEVDPKKLKSTLMYVWTAMTAGFIIMWIALSIQNVPCDNPKLVANYDIDKFLGTWYELRRNFDLPFEGGDCVTAQYAKRTDGGIDVINSQYYIDQKKFDSIKGYAYTSKFTSGLNNVFFNADFGGDYRVLDTDYTNFAVVYSCTTILGGCLSIFKYVWVLSRKPLTYGTAEYDTFMVNVNAILAAKTPKYDTRIMRPTIHNPKCVYATGLSPTF